MADSVPAMDIDWNSELRSQLEWHWENQLRPRLDGLTDDEYFWEPVTGCWSVRPCDRAAAKEVAGSGEFVLEFAFPEPRPAPVTTIAWLPRSHTPWSGDLAAP